MGSFFLILAAFLASAVEMVEALTIVLAVGMTRGWRSTAIGTGTATVALAASVAAVGPALVRIPVDALHCGCRRPLSVADRIARLRGRRDGR